MTDAKYEKIRTEHGEEDDLEELNESISTRSNIAIACQPKEVHSVSTNSIMQTPYSLVALILIYFALSISLTFYQRNLLKVCELTSLCY